MSSEPKISCAPNGPYLVKNLETFANSSGDKIPVKATMALCRCGASKNKPFKPFMPGKQPNPTSHYRRRARVVSGLTF
jgi:hypothetical protein